MKFINILAHSNIARLTLKFQTIAIEFIEPLFFFQHPGPILIFIIRLIGPLVRIMQPSDRWNLPAFLKRWSTILKVSSPCLTSNKKNIFIFTSYRGQFTLDIVLAFLLAWRGHRVVLGYFPKLRSPIKDPLVDSPNAKSYLNTTLNSIENLSGGRVRCVDLSDYVGKSPFLDYDFIKQQVHSDIVMKIRKERLDFSDKYIQDAALYYHSLAENALSAALSYFQHYSNNIDLLLIANGASFESAYFLHAAKYFNIPVTTFEKFAFSNARTITHGGPFYSFTDLDIIFEEASRIKLNNPHIREAICEQAWQLLKQRKTSSGSAWGWQYQKKTRSASSIIFLKQFKLKTNEFVLICPNVPFDAGYGSWLTIFPSMRDWLVRSIQYLITHTDLMIIVRAHPAECKAGFDLEKVSKILADANITSDRVIQIAGDSDINTYDLMPLCRFGLVFSSTTGVEIAMHGKPVIAGANVYYARCGATLAADSEDTYFQQIDNVIMGLEVESGAFRKERAALIYSLFHYNLQWHYPYDKPSHVVAMPPAKFPKSPLVQRYIRTLDVLAMSPTEFREALPELIDLSSNPWI